MGALTRSADGKRMELPVTDTEHIPRKLVYKIFMKFLKIFVWNGFLRLSFIPC